MTILILFVAYLFVAAAGYLWGRADGYDAGRKSERAVTGMAAMSNPGEVRQ